MEPPQLLVDRRDAAAVALSRRVIVEGRGVHAIL
jgi:hypothetical protein